MKVRAQTAFILFLTALLTQTAAFGRKAQNYHLGPTGLFGTISKTTAKVTSVAKGSPADGKIKKGDQVTGVGETPFKKDVRRELARAINQAETEQGGGTLTLILKDNKTVELKLTVLGSYSDTAPYDCPKSDAIIKRAADYLVNSGKPDAGKLHTGLLGLMATGEKEYIDVVAEAIKNAKWTDLKQDDVDALLRGDIDMGYVGWYWGYHLITLCEYHLLTGDESVLPVIGILATSLARGQDAGGLWGHRMATEKRNGRLPGYAQMNQPSLSNLMGMALAEKCGVSNPQLKKGLEKTYAYVSSHVHRGSFPYGVHGPQTRSYNNNGTSGSAALCMAIRGNSEGTTFFSQLAATTYDGMEVGHASTFFNPLWTPLGANLSGPEVTQAFFKKSRWLHTMYRGWDGSFSRFGGNSKEGSQTGVALLTYCIPRKALVITGRGADKSIWLQGDDAIKVVERSKIDYSKKSVEELLALFDHPIPHVRRGAIWTLREKDGDFLPKLVHMIENGTDRQKQSAMGYFGWKCPPEQALPQIDKVGAVLRDEDEDPWVRAAAAAALAPHGEAAYSYYNDMLKLVIADEPDDRFNEVDLSVGKSLNWICKTPFESGLVTDKDLFYNAAIKLIRHKRQHARGPGLRMLAGMPIEDFHRVADHVMHVIEDKDSTYHSYHSWQGSIGAAITILANLNIREGLTQTAGVLDREGGKWGFKVRMVCAALPKYGAHAKDALAKLKADERLKNIEKGRFRGIWNRMVNTIEEDKNPEPLISLEEAIKMGKKND